MVFQVLVILLLLAILSLQLVIFRRLGFRFNFFSKPYDGTDALLPQAKEIIIKYDKVSASLLQRKLSIGYSRAAKLLDLMEEDGLVSPAVGAEPRKVLSKQQETKLAN